MVTCSVAHGSERRNHGICLMTGSSHLILPSSTRTASDEAVMCLLTDAIPNRLFSSTGADSPSYNTPNPPVNAISPSFTTAKAIRSEEHTSELQSRGHLVCRLLLDKKKT